MSYLGARAVETLPPFFRRRRGLGDTAAGGYRSGAVTSDASGRGSTTTVLPSTEPRYQSPAVTTPAPVTQPAAPAASAPTSPAVQELQTAANLFAAAGYSASCQAYRTSLPTGGSYDQGVCQVPGSSDYYDARLTSYFTPAQVAASVEQGQVWRPVNYSPVQLFATSYSTPITPVVTAQSPAPGSPTSPTAQTPATAAGAAIPPLQPPAAVNNPDTFETWCARYPAGSFGGRPCTVSASSSAPAAAVVAPVVQPPTVSESISAFLSSPASVVDRISNGPAVVAGVNNWVLMAAAAAAAWWALKQ